MLPAWFKYISIYLLAQTNFIGQILAFILSYPLESKNMAVTLIHVSDIHFGSGEVHGKINPATVSTSGSKTLSLP